MINNLEGVFSLLKRRRAEAGEYIVNIKTGFIKNARFVDIYGSAVVKESFNMHTGSVDLICWEEDEYLVLEIDEYLEKARMDAI